MTVGSMYEHDLNQTTANYTPLTPLSFLERTAAIYPDHVSVVHGARHFTWSQTYARARRLASALAGRGIRPGDTVAIMGSNTPETYELAFGPAMIGAVINMLNVRLDATTIAFILNHGEGCWGCGGTLRVCVRVQSFWPLQIRQKQNDWVGW